jgi:hypothetical protein
MNTVVQLQPATIRKTSASTRRHARRSFKLRRQGRAAVMVGLVALVMVALSLKHLAHGVELITGSPQWEAWAMAIGIDLSFISIELGQLVAVTEAVRRRGERFARPMIAGTLVGSAAMNAYAFGWQAVGYMTYPAAGFGLAIPVIIYLLTRYGAGLWLATMQDK